ncbi:death-associated protein-like 1 isoform X2 [Panthera leo]|uniref:death-associated protein-like 1 isoform X2 n=1 Tax=Panthera leo TaxID=9689 RepID=UPI001C69704E|nr:death-associated protein-like 1 isoform X2 [Panthera leo]
MQVYKSLERLPPPPLPPPTLLGHSHFSVRVGVLYSFSAPVVNEQFKAYLLTVHCEQCTPYCLHEDCSHFPPVSRPPPPEVSQGCRMGDKRDLSKTAMHPLAGLLPCKQKTNFL